MADENKQPTSPGSSRHSWKPPRISWINVIMVCLPLIWVMIAGGFFLIIGGMDISPLNDQVFAIALIAVFVPAALIWVIAAAMQSNRLMRKEAMRLRIAIDAMQQSGNQPLHDNGANEASINLKLDEFSAAQQRLENAITALSPPRSEHDATTPAAAKPASDRKDPSKPTLGIRVVEQSQPLTAADFTRALNFPEDIDDTDGFNALRRVLKDRQAAQLAQTSRDILAMLSQDGIYMDDLQPDVARPELWREFARGKRGSAVDELGGVKDKSSLDLIAKRIRRDTTFRDTARNFLLHFDKVFAKFASNASDAEITAFGDTRTARAFMLLGKAMGTFND